MEITGEKGGGEHGAGWTAPCRRCSLASRLWTCVSSSFCPNEAKRVTGGQCSQEPWALLSSRGTEPATAPLSGSASPSATRRDRSQLSEGFGKVAVYSRRWDARRGDPGQDEIRQLSHLPEHSRRFGAWGMHGETAGLGFWASLSICKLAADCWDRHESSRISEPWAAALCPSCHVL